MHEFNLIPAGYLERELIERKCLNFFIVLMALLISLVVARVGLSQVIIDLKAKIDTMENGKNLKLQQQQKFNELLTEERVLTKRLEIFDGIRGGQAAKQVFLILDRILDGSVWFSELKFQREGEIAEAPSEAQQSGYFLIVPDNVGALGKTKVWHLKTHLEITGQAYDHSKLSQFVKKILEQPEIEDVKVINTNLKTYTATQAVDFKMIVFINNKFKA